LNEDNKKSTRELQKKIASEWKFSSQLTELSARLVKVDSEIVPKFERTVNDLNEHLQLKDKEIVKVLAEVKALKGELEEITRKGESFRKEAKLKRRNAEKSQQLIKRFQRDLFQVVDRRANEDFKALKDGRCATVFPICSRRRH
jgi:chromosome segregation ATPase